MHMLWRTTLSQTAAVLVLAFALVFAPVVHNHGFERDCEDTGYHEAETCLEHPVCPACVLFHLSQTTDCPPDAPLALGVIPDLPLRTPAPRPVPALLTHFVSPRAPPAA